MSDNETVTFSQWHVEFSDRETGEILFRWGYDDEQKARTICEMAQLDENGPQTRIIEWVINVGPPTVSVS